MEPVSTLLKYPNIELTFVEPDSSGLVVLDYEIVFFDKAQNGYRKVSELCDGLDSTTIDALSCTFSVEDAISELSCSHGDLLLAKARARNSEGFGLFSSPNSSGAIIETVPVFMYDPQVSTYTTTEISLTWQQLLFNNENGASPITFYSLEWDQGTSNFVPLNGEDDSII